MDFAERERIIRRYLDYVTAGTPDGTYRVADMKEIARRAGMSDQEIAEVQRAAQSYYEHGWVHRRAERWDEAVEQLTVAAALDPGNVDVQFELASAYAGRWRRDRRDADRAEAERLLARCNEIVPMHAPSMRLLKTLDAPGSPSPNARSGSRPTKRRLGALLAVVGLLILGAGIAMVGVKDSGKPGPILRDADETKQTIPVSLAPLKEHPDARLQLEESVLDPDRVTYHLKGRLIFDSDSALAARHDRIVINSGVEIRFRAIDSSGDVAFAAQITPTPCIDLSGSVCFDYTTPFIMGLRQIQLESTGGTRVEVEDPRRGN